MERQPNQTVPLVVTGNAGPFSKMCLANGEESHTQHNSRATKGEAIENERILSTCFVSKTIETSMAESAIIRTPPSMSVNDPKRVDTLWAGADLNCGYGHPKAEGYQATPPARI